MGLWDFFVWRRELREAIFLGESDCIMKTRAAYIAKKTRWSRVAAGLLRMHDALTRKSFIRYRPGIKYNRKAWMDRYTLAKKYFAACKKSGQRPKKYMRQAWFFDMKYPPKVRTSNLKPQSV